MFTYRFAGRRKGVLVGAIAGAMLLLSIAVVFAQGPQPGSPRAAALGTGFTYQGQLKNGSGPVNGQCDIAFRLYDDPGVGNQIGIAITQTIPITGGLFTTALDFGAGAFNGQARWLQIALSNTCPATGSFTTLSPRQALSAAPYALFSAAPWVTSGSSLYYNGGKVGIGTANPGATLQVAGSGLFGTDGGGLNPSVGAGIRIFRDGFDGVANIYAFDYGAGSPFTLTLQAPGGNVGIGTTAPADKLSVAGIVATTGGVRFPDGTLQTTAARHGQNVIVVAKSGGDYTTIGAALASIVDASATNHYLIYVAPGTYTETVTMKQYVDIEGAGELTTKITQVGNASQSTGTIVGTDYAELRFLTVENTGGNTYAIAIYNSGASPRLTHVTANASGGTTAYGVFNQSSASPVMSYVTANATGASSANYGVSNDHSSPLMNYVTAVVSASIGSNTAVYNYFASPTINNSTASTMGGGSPNIAISNQDSSPSMTNVTASATGSGSQNIGVNNIYSSLTVNNSTISASGGSTNWGIHNYATSGSLTLQVNGSQVSGSDTAILDGNPCTCTVLVGASQLIGGHSGGGTFKCVAVYDGSYVSAGLNTCP